MTKLLKKIALVTIVLALAAPVISAQTKRGPQSAMDETVRTLFAAKDFAGVVISPDGKQVAWVQDSAIYVAEAHSGAKPHRITAGDGRAVHDESAPSWSRDSRKLTFLSDAAKAGQQQLYVVNAAGGPARKLTNVKGFLTSPSWSPDGKTIALLFTENAERAAGPLVAEVAQTGVIKEYVTEQRLALVDVAGGTCGRSRLPTCMSTNMTGRRMAGAS